MTEYKTESKLGGVPLKVDGGKKLYPGIETLKVLSNRHSDPGQHYRYEYKGIKLDPARIAKIYGMTSGMMFTVLKKCLCAGNRGHKDYRQDLLDMRNAIDREIEMIDEDNNCAK
jgi:hypothetical protein